MDIFLGESILGGEEFAQRPVERKGTKQRDVFHASNEVKLLQHQVERLSLLNQAMWELLRERGGMTDADLERKAQEVDMRDGVEDGKITATPVKCPQCNRISNSKHAQCMYCGLEFQKDMFA